MDYNTQRTKLSLPEYGRNIQQMVDHICATPDKNERNRLAKVIIGIMCNMNPHLRDINDFKHKLWDHLFIMSDFKIDIDSPYPIPEKESIQERPKRVPYPTHPIRHKHYGRAIEQMIQKASEMEEGPSREALTQLIANHMKKSYLMWNKDAVSDEDIIRDILELSNGKLVVAPGTKLTDNRDLHNRGGKKRFQQRKK